MRRPSSRPGASASVDNINADTVAGAVAGALKADRMLLLTDVPGVMDRNGNLIERLTTTEARALIKDGTISGGMIPKVETCIDAVERGVRAAVEAHLRRQHPGESFGASIPQVITPEFVRDEIAEKNIGHDGHKFTSLLCSFFFFILVAALLGLVPLPQYADGHWSLAGTVSTGNLAVTLALAGISFLAQQWAGISKFGVVHHFQNLIPPGLPAWLLPVMIPVEILGMFTKPFALMVRLFANMLAGHMVITALLMLIPLMAKVATVAGVMVTPVSLGLALFIMVLEVLVAFIQAYIFTLLTAIFIGVYAHPAH